jgi:hypothetical protein
MGGRGVKEERSSIVRRTSKPSRHARTSEPMDRITLLALAATAAFLLQFCYFNRNFVLMIVRRSSPYTFQLQLQLLQDSTIPTTALGMRATLAA